MAMTSKCRVVLLNPPTAACSNVIILSLAYLSSALKAKGHEVLVIDATASCNPLSEDEVRYQIQSFKPNFIGITLNIGFIVDTYEYIGRLRKLGFPIVAGGPHASGLPEEVLESGVHVSAIGEGEETIVELCDYFLGHCKLEEISGICYKDESSIKYTSPRGMIKNLDTVAFPDFESFPIRRYTGNNDPYHPVFWSIFTSRGCPYDCTFCSKNVFKRSIRERSPENVWSEIKELYVKFGATHFAFQDDEAFLNKKRMLNFCNLIIESKLPLTFSGRLRIDSVDNELLAKLKEAGFIRLSFGVESLNDETLRKVNKRYKTEDVLDGFRAINESKFPSVSFNNLIGFPWEDENHLSENLRSIDKIPKTVNCFSYVGTPVPYPGTKIYIEYHKQYGFTNWWLDKKSSRSQLHMDHGPFFMKYAGIMTPLSSPDRFWNYSPSTEKSIKNYCWAILKRCWKQRMGRMEFLSLYYLSRLSYFCWGIHSLVERLFLCPIKLLYSHVDLSSKASFSGRITKDREGT